MELDDKYICHAGERENRYSKSLEVEDTWLKSEDIAPLEI